MKDIKHIRRDFHSVARVMPQGWDFGALGVPRGLIKSSISDWIFILSPGSCLGVKNQNPSYCLSVMLSPKPFNEIHKQIWCVSYSHEWGVQGIFCLAPGALGWGQKVNYHLISLTRSISKIFYTKLCVCSPK